MSRDPHDVAGLGRSLRAAALSLAEAHLCLRRGEWNAARVHVVAGLQSVTAAEIALPTLKASDGAGAANAGAD